MGGGHRRTFILLLRQPNPAKKQPLSFSPTADAAAPVGLLC